MAKIFTKIVKEITICAKEGGTDPKTNSKLRALIQNAKNANMPKENIQRALQKANESNTIGYRKILFEGYAPHGIAILIETATDNNNRTVANIRSYFNKFGVSLGISGSVEYMFEHKLPNLGRTLDRFPLDKFSLVVLGLQGVVLVSLQALFVVVLGVAIVGFVPVPDFDSAMGLVVHVAASAE